MCRDRTALFLLFVANEATRDRWNVVYSIPLTTVIFFIFPFFSLKIIDALDNTFVETHVFQQQQQSCPPQIASGYHRHCACYRLSYQHTPAPQHQNPHHNIL